MTDWVQKDTPNPNFPTIPAVSDNQEPLYTRRDQIVRTPKCGFRGFITNATSTLYTAPSVSSPTGSTQGAFLKALILCNTDTSARTVTVYLVESGGSAADNRAIYKDLSLISKATQVLLLADDECFLESGETIQAVASVTNVVSCRISVVEVTH